MGWSSTSTTTPSPRNFRYLWHYLSRTSQLFGQLPYLTDSLIPTKLHHIAIINMPVLPGEDTAEGGITEKVAKNPSSQTESTASGHAGHDNEHGTVKASMQDIQSKGPQIPQTDKGKPPLLPRLQRSQLYRF